MNTDIFAHTTCIHIEFYFVRVFSNTGIRNLLITITSSYIPYLFNANIKLNIENISQMSSL